MSKLSALSPQRQVFVRELAKGGSATAAARVAKYKHPDVMGCRLGKVQIVSEALQEILDRQTSASVMGEVERKEVLSQMARGEIEDDSKNPIGNQRAAIVELAKMGGDYESDTPKEAPGPMVVVQVATDAALIALARKAPR